MGSSDAWVDFKGRVRVAKDLAQGATVSLMDRYEPMVRETLTEKISPIAIKKLQDERFIRDLAERAYEMIPGLVRVAIPRKTFVKWVLQNKSRLINVVTVPPSRDKVSPKRKLTKKKIRVRKKKPSVRKKKAPVAKKKASVRTKKTRVRKTTASKVKAVKRKTSRKRIRRPAAEA